MASNITLEQNLRELGDEVLDENGPAVVDGLKVESIKNKYGIQPVSEVLSGETTADGFVIVDRKNREAAVLPVAKRQEGGDYILDVEEIGSLDEVIMDLRNRYEENAEIDEAYC